MRRKEIAVIVCTILICSTLVGCGMSIGGAKVKPINGAKVVNKQEIVEIENIDDSYVNGLNEFAFQTFNKLEDGENVLISPYSITLALSMLYNGADGDTRTEMAELFGYNMLDNYTKDYSESSNNYMNANSKVLIDSLQKADQKATISIANSIWLAENAVFKDSAETALFSPVRAYYNGDIYQVDFEKEETLKQVNQWVSDKTEGMIDPFLEAFTDNLRLLLVNAIYFNGEWTVPFEPDKTIPTTFSGLDSTNEVDTMYMSEETYRYYSIDGIRGLEIPYGNGRLVMDVLIPEDKNNTNIGELYGALTSQDKSDFLNKLDSTDKTKVQSLALPKFKIEYGMVELNKTLQDMGMKSAFEDSANLDLIGDDLFVSLVGHTAKIEVEEWGTKASAATVVETNTTAMPVETEPLNFLVNIPFIFLIRDTQTGTILFMGEINDLK